MMLSSKKRRKEMRAISRYSGKCDFYDTLEIFGADRILDQYKVYHNLQLIDFHGKKRNLIPWYPYIVGSMGSGPDGGTIFLSRYSWPYQTDLDYFDLVVKRFKSKLSYQKRKAKKTGTTFDPDSFIEDFVKEWSWPWEDNPQLWDICSQIARGEKPQYPLRPSTKWMMRELCLEMVRNKLNPSDYGYTFVNDRVIDYKP